MTKIAGSGSASESGSISQRQGSADPDPDPHENVMDPEHCLAISSCLVRVGLTHKVRTYKEYHMYAPRRNWDSPQPPTRGTLAGEKEGWESPNSDEGHTLWYSLYVHTLWVDRSVRVSATPSYHRNDAGGGGGIYFPAVLISLLV
jgi:hypothetical protein